jgi:hypothetical protein
MHGLDDLETTIEARQAELSKAERVIHRCCIEIERLERMPHETLSRNPAHARYPAVGMPGESLSSGASGRPGRAC